VLARRIDASLEPPYRKDYKPSIPAALGYALVADTLDAAASNLLAIWG
jgi:hypothetical protein